MLGFFPYISNVCREKKQKFSLLLTVASLTHIFIILKFNYFNLLIVGVMKSCDLTAFFSMIFHFLKKKV